MSTKPYLQTLRPLLLLAALLLTAASTTYAQGPPPLPGGAAPPIGGPSRGGGGGAGGGAALEPQVIARPPEPVIIDGKQAEQLSDEEKLSFLQDKIKEVLQGDGQVQLIRVAPGYPVTLSFDEPIQSIIVGDPAMVTTEQLNAKLVVLSPLTRAGDTSMQIYFPGNKLRVYHIFITETFLDGETAIRVGSFSDSEDLKTVGLTRDQKLDVRTIIQIIRNYDLLLKEGAINKSMVKRDEIFRHSEITSFTTYYLYRFASQPAALTFAYRNPYPYAVRYDESRLRVALGRVRYIPDYVSLHKTNLAPGEVTTGFAIIAQPSFSFDQPFELVWK